AEEGRRDLCESVFWSVFSSWDDIRQICQGLIRDHFTISAIIQSAFGDGPWIASRPELNSTKMGSLLKWLMTLLHSTKPRHFEGAAYVLRVILSAAYYRKGLTTVELEQVYSFFDIP